MAVVVMVRTLRGRWIAIIIIRRDQGRARCVPLLTIRRDLIFMVMIRQISGERPSKGVGRVNLAAGVQRPIHHRHGRLNHKQGDQHCGQSRYAFPKPIVQVLEQISLDGVASGDIVAASPAQINASQPSRNGGGWTIRRAAP